MVDFPMLDNLFKRVMAGAGSFAPFSNDLFIDFWMKLQPPGVGMAKSLPPAGFRLGKVGCCRGKVKTVIVPFEAFKWIGQAGKKRISLSCRSDGDVLNPPFLM